jgi:RHS repeat-associated protein
VPRAVPSDLNYDGVIDGTDEAIYWEQYAAIDSSWHAGDFRGEGRLSFTARELGGTAPGVSQALPQTGFTAAGQLDIDNRFGYAGYIWDQHLGIYHVRHRTYDPFAGRWLQPDPLALMGPELLLALTSSDGSNLYAYVGNNPNGFVDPYGLWKVVDVPGRFAGQDGTYHHFYRTERHYFWGFIPTTNVVETFSHSDFTAAGEDTSRIGTTAEQRYQAVTLGSASNEVQAAAYAAGTAGEIVVRIVVEPVDTALTVVEIVQDPSDFRNYAGLLPIVPGVAGKVAKHSDEAADLLRTATSGSDSARGPAAEAYIDLKFREDGWESLPTKYNTSNNGFDGVYVKYADDGNVEQIVIVEVKAGRGDGSYTNSGKQLSDGWTNETIEKMKEAGGPVAETAKFIADNLDNVQRMKIRIDKSGTVRSNLVDSGGNVIRPGGSKLPKMGVDGCQSP